IRFKDVVRFGARGCRKDAVLLVTMGVAGGALGIVTPYATGLLVGSIIPSADRSQLLRLTMSLLRGAVAGAMFDVTRRLALVRIAGRLGSAVQAAVWDRLLSLPMPFFRSYAAGDLAVRAMSMDTIRQLLSSTAVTALLGGLFSVFNFG